MDLFLCMSRFGLGFPLSLGFINVSVIKEAQAITSCADIASGTITSLSSAF